jgi:hypothetical protein
MLGRPRNVEGLRTPRIGAVSKSENGVRTILGRLAGWGAGQTSARRTKEGWTGRGSTQKQERINLLLLLPCCRGLTRADGDGVMIKGWRGRRRGEEGDGRMKGGFLTVVVGFGGNRVDYYAQIFPFLPSGGYSRVGKCW